MLEQYLQHIVTDGVLVTCSLTMVALFLFDLAGLLDRSGRIHHADFKSSIMSIGIFGTFLGILSGLYGFDSTNIAASVPKLLEGLRFAFATSVLGMFFTVALSILQKLFGKGKDETNALASIDSKISSIEKTAKSLAATIESPHALIGQFNEMKVFLQKELQKINTSLDKALLELAAGATKEVIQALERVIQDFNKNLQEQFGENFKELNKACFQLVQWQTSYREHVDQAEGYLKQLLGSLEVSAKSAKELVESNAETQEICREVKELIKTYDIQINTLATHLESCKRLGEEAKSFLSDTSHALNQATNNMASFAGVIEGSVNEQSETLSKLTQDIHDQLPKSLGELEDVLTKITNQFANDYRSLFEFITAKR